MTPSPHVARAQLLLSQNRPRQAEEILRHALASDPGDGACHALLALCLLRDRERLAEATREAEQAVHLAPDQAYAHFVLALVLDRRNRDQAALEAIDRAIAIDPEDADYHGVRARLLGALSRWKDALAAAETGLSHDPAHGTCSAIRSTALERTGRLGDALGEADRAVRQDPDSSSAHASRGWALLARGDDREARVAFREALRLEPGNEFAREGMIQAINSGNVVFRGFYRAMLWVSRLDSRVQWALILGAWVGVRMLNSLAKAHPWLAPWVLPISIAYLLVAMMSWILMPVFNTMLRFHPFGRHLLNRDEIWASNLVAGALASGLVFGPLVWLLSGDPGRASLVVLFAVELTIPLAVVFGCEARWARATAAVVAAAFTLAYLAIVAACATGTPPGALVGLFGVGIVLYCFASRRLQSAKAVT